MEKIRAYITDQDPLHPIYHKIIEKIDAYRAEDVDALLADVARLVMAANDAPIKRLDESELVFIGRYKFFYIKLKQAIAAVEARMGEKKCTP